MIAAATHSRGTQDEPSLGPGLNRSALSSMHMAPSRLTSSRVAISVAILLAVAFYLYPTFKARLQLGSVAMPPIFAPDLTMYLNLSQITDVDNGHVMNPYYRIPVPSDGAGYLKFHLAPGLFGSLNRLLGSRLWFALLLWNGFWWALLAVVSVWLFDRFLPVSDPDLL